MIKFKTTGRILLTSLLLGAAVAPAALAATWWDNAWTVRKPVVINTGGEGAAIAGPVGKAVMLVRLFDANFTFDTAQDNGADIRFVAADGKTVLPHHIERWDRALNEALVWVQAPEIQPGGATRFFLYSGNPAATPDTAGSKATYDADTALVYHFSEASGPPADSSGGAVNATTAGLPVSGALIAGGTRLTGQNPVTIPASRRLKSTAS
ncbi:MAG: DUF2341 domain-containing protein [Verrucomicrobiaceae bacterium]|nr:MAG: DUF2341 domain-containing protein [Verrucomicrobiaceae bacterium]